MTQQHIEKTSFVIESPAATDAVCTCIWISMADRQQELIIVYPFILGERRLRGWGGGDGVCNALGYMHQLVVVERCLEICCIFNPGSFCHVCQPQASRLRQPN